MHVHLHIYMYSYFLELTEKTSQMYKYAMISCVSVHTHTGVYFILRLYCKGLYRYIDTWSKCVHDQNNIRVAYKFI